MWDKLYLNFISSQSMILLLLPPFGVYFLIAGNDPLMVSFNFKSNCSELLAMLLGTLIVQHLS